MTMMEVLQTVTAIQAPVHLDLDHLVHPLILLTAMTVPTRDRRDLHDHQDLQVHPVLLEEVIPTMDHLDLSVRCAVELMPRWIAP